MSLRSRSKCLLALAVANVALVAAPGVPFAQAETWVGPSPSDGSMGGDWNTAAHWNPQSVPNAIGAVAIVNGPPTAAASTRNLTLSAATTLGSLTFNDNDTDALLNTRATTVNGETGPLLTFDNGGAGATINTEGFATITGANLFNIRGPVYLAENLTINANLLRASSAPGGVPVYDTANITLNFLGSAGSAITGPGGITKNGPATVAFADTAKAFTGPVVINQGRIRFNAAAGNAGGFSGTSSVTVNSGGQLHFDQAGTGTNNLGASANMVVTLNGNGTASYSGAIRVETGRITSMWNKINLATDASITTNGATSQFTLSNIISGPGALSHNNGPAAGAGTLILTGNNTDFSTYAGGTINHAGTLRIGAGGSVGSGNVTNNGQFQVYANATLAGVSGSGSTTIGDGAIAVTVTANHFRQSALTVNGTAVVAPTGGTAAGASNVNTLTIAPAGTLDLRDNKLVTNKPLGTFSGGTYSGLQGDIARAYNFGSWGLPGLTTSEDLADPTSGPLGGTTTIAVNKASEVLFIGETDTALFAGQTVTGASSIAMYTYAGDINLDGLVDAADYGVIDNWIQFPGTDGYMNGDFNYDGVIDAADYGIIDNSIQLQGAPFPGVNSTFAAAGPAGVTAVPEPAAGGLALLAAARLLARRRRRYHATR